MLVTVGGLVIACTHNNGAGTTAACYLDGIANGLVFAPFMALVGEISVPYLRGKASATLEQLCFGTGILLQIIYVSNWTYSSYMTYNDFTSENMKGVLSTIYGVLALIMGSFFTIESPVLMLANNEEQAAIDALRRLQKPAVLTEKLTSFWRSTNATWPTTRICQRVKAFPKRCPPSCDLHTCAP